jgi:superfamily II RNA helicase
VQQWYKSFSLFTMLSAALSAAELQQIFPFELDRFQLQAFNALNQGKSVVVCAPTGSGKTLIGEYAIHRARKSGGRVFYTTPLKALSNQKFRDFRAEFGRDEVGLLTGDVSINRDAAIVVMTTEIFRNMLYGTRIGEVGTSLVGVEAVVLDECHYMNDKQRGTVWEESIIYCPKGVQIVALSATVANSQQLTEWIDHVHGPTELVYSDYRPVPLQFYFANPKGLLPLLDNNTDRVNPKLKSNQPKGSRRREDVPSNAFIVSKLQERDMLPAIFFIFSRKGCDQAVVDMGIFNLVSLEEELRLKQKIDEWAKANPEAIRQSQIEALYHGVAAHHAGILPAWKVLVEELFGEGLIKVVFATETLAAGINMPARTTVISSLSKRTDQGHRLLTASEFLQMSGRAGRRGKDTIGNVVTVQSRFEGATEAAFLATSQADPLVSQFTPTYGMVLNLLQTHSLEEARELVERSFGQFTATSHLMPQQQAIREAEKELQQLQTALEQVQPSVLEDYESNNNQMKLEQAQLKNLQLYFDQVRANQVARLLPDAEPGALLSLKGKHVPVGVPVTAVLVAKSSVVNRNRLLLCLSNENRWYVVNTQDVVAIHPNWKEHLNGRPVPAVASLQSPEDMPLRVGQVRKGGEGTAEIAALVPQLELGTSEELAQQMTKIDLLKQHLENHPVWQWGNPANLIKRHRRRAVLEKEISDRQEQLQKMLAHHWQEFLSLIEVLRHMGGLNDIMPTALGEDAAAIRGDNELWLALAISSGFLDDLEPQDLAAAMCALVSETPRNDSWVNYEPPEMMMMALSALRNTRRQLFQSQRRHEVNLPVWMEYEMVGLVQNWALDVPWLELCNSSSLDEGDVVRMLRRTVDLLSQLPHVPHISDKLKTSARQAVQLIDRFPVNEKMD